MNALGQHGLPPTHLDYGKLMEALSNEKRYKAIEEAYETSVAANQPDQQEADISA